MSFVRALGMILLPLLGIAWLSPSAKAQTPEGSLTLKECLAIRLNVRGGRSPIHIDPIEAQVVAGKFLDPQDGEALNPPAQRGTLRWTRLAANPNGEFEHASLMGGYAFWKVRLTQAQTMILEAAGHTMVYVNGEPRVGDVYRTGMTRLPVLLKAGDNQLLFSCARGYLRAQLRPAKPTAQLNLADLTLPDFVIGERAPQWGAAIVLNPTDKPLTNLRLRVDGEEIASSSTLLPPIPPYGMRKTGFRIPAPRKTSEGGCLLRLSLLTGSAQRPLETAPLSVRMRTPAQSRKRTFLSAIDGSVQYYATLPANPLAKNAPPPALVLTLHGASVEAIGQADAYSSKTWAHLVAPTNRRPYGFDWEDWGRQDALEVLDIAQKTLPHNPQRVYLTGHSMGGHGTWQTAVQFADRFAAIAPSAGWISFFSYAGGSRNPTPSPTEALFQRAANPSDTLALMHNLAPLGVYILHGAADDNVPASEAQEMNRQLAAFHRDFTYFEQPGAGHWWDSSDEPGADCVDWAPLFDFFSRRTLPPLEAVRDIAFSTANPAISSRFRWAEVLAQERPLAISSIQLRYDPGKRRFSGKTQNVAVLALDTAHIAPNAPLALDIDGTKIDSLPYPDAKRIWLKRQSDRWSLVAAPAASQKNPRRYGPFKEAFRNHMILVYGTQGTPEENAWAFAKARYDAETFWYRGNGSVDLCADSAFDPKKNPDRNIILYGNRATNRQWDALLSDSPLQIDRGIARMGDKALKGEDYACLMIRPRPNSETASVGVVSGSGLAGMRLTDKIPYFSSGVAFPDFTLLKTDTLENGYAGVKSAGFFGIDWAFSPHDTLWNP